MMDGAQKCFLILNNQHELVDRYVHCQQYAKKVKGKWTYYTNSKNLKGMNSLQAEKVVDQFYKIKKFLEENKRYLNKGFEGLEFWDFERTLEMTDQIIENVKLKIVHPPQKAADEGAKKEARRKVMHIKKYGASNPSKTKEEILASKARRRRQHRAYGPRDRWDY